MDKLKHVGLIVGMAFIAVVFAVLTIYVEDPLLDSQVTTGPNILLDEWRQLFRYWATFGIAIGLVAALIWYLLGQWGLSLNNWTNANNKRVVWLLFLLLPLGAFVTGWLLTPPVQEGAFLATVFYLANNVAVYYLGTLCFSPSSFKYTPLGASTLRRW
ncbi:MAG TPA: hypothetical protein VMR98_00110 [Candidatus Polarisedimenticolaceae bacterium]|nr:hypothetical protein [Candidatus Polarisedimenticolaceae bacterium]